MRRILWLCPCNWNVLGLGGLQRGACSRKGRRRRAPQGKRPGLARGAARPCLDDPFFQAAAVRAANRGVPWPDFSFEPAGPQEGASVLEALRGARPYDPLYVDVQKVLLAASGRQGPLDIRARGLLPLLHSWPAAMVLEWLGQIAQRR